MPLQLTYSVVDNLPTARVFTASNYCNGRVFVFGGCDRMGVALNTAECWNPDGAVGSQWTTLAPIPTKKAATTSITFGNQIFTFGGICGNKQQLVEVDAFEMNTGKWTSLTPLPEPTQGIGVAVRNDKILCVGGVTSDMQALSRFFCFDPIRHKFAAFPNMPTARYQPSLMYHNDRDALYVLGGRVGKFSTNVCEVFEFRALKWRALDEKSTEKRVFSNWLAVNDKVYIMGGLRDETVQGFSKKLDIFDVQTESWSSGPELLQGRGDACLGIINNHLVLCGGFGEPGIESSVHSLHLNHLDEESVWQSHLATPVPHASAGYCALTNEMLLIGGMDKAGLLNRVDLLQST